MVTRGAVADCGGCRTAVASCEPHEDDGAVLEEDESWQAAAVVDEVGRASDCESYA